MKRPKIGKKLNIQMEHEPNLVAISAKFPVPYFPVSREIILVAETIEHGPRVKMHHQASTQRGDRLANANTDVSNMDSKPEALPVAHRGVDIYRRPWNQHQATSTCNPFAAAVQTRNVSSVNQAHEFGTDVSNMDSKPEALSVAHRGVDIYGRPWNQHQATSTCNPFAAAVRTRNVSSVTQEHEFGTAIAKATANMARIGMINQYQNRELVIKFRREVRASLAYEQLLNYHNGSSPVVQAQGVNLTSENIHNIIMQTLDRKHFTNSVRPF
jgi:hypothetical protein